LTRTDLGFVVSRIPKDIRELVQNYPSLNIAGGFIRATIAREKVSDIDLFGPDKSTLKMAAQELALTRKGRTYETKNAITVLAYPRKPAQFITRWCFDSTEKLIESFDYTIAQAAIGMQIDGETGKHVWYGLCSDEFYPDLAARRLVYTAPRRAEDAGGSMMRLRKFLQRGYTIQAPSMAAVIARLMSGINLERLHNIADGDEKEVGRMICNLLREIDEHEIEGGAA
jgi:hypothetical protein